MLLLLFAERNETLELNDSKKVRYSIIILHRKGKIVDVNFLFQIIRKFPLLKVKEQRGKGVKNGQQYRMALISDAKTTRLNIYFTFNDY